MDIVAPPPAVALVGIPTRDGALLHTLAGTIVAAITALHREHCGTLPYVLHAHNDAGHARRIVLFQQPEHVQTRPCAFVGFIGKKQPTITSALVDDVVAADERIMEALIGHHDVLGYASLEMPDRNWGNLVLFRRAEAVALLHQHPAHQHAAQELAPRFYQWIHLYHGHLPAGILTHATTLAVTKSQHYIFGDDDARTDD